MMMGYEHIHTLIEASACVAELVRRVRPSADWKPLSKKPHRWRPCHDILSKCLLPWSSTSPPVPFAH